MGITKKDLIFIGSGIFMLFTIFMTNYFEQINFSKNTQLLLSVLMITILLLIYILMQKHDSSKIIEKNHDLLSQISSLKQENTKKDLELATIKDKLTAMTDNRDALIKIIDDSAANTKALEETIKSLEGELNLQKKDTFTIYSVLLNDQSSEYKKYFLTTILQQYPMLSSEYSIEAIHEIIQLNDYQRKVTEQYGQQEITHN